MVTRQNSQSRQSDPDAATKSLQLSCSMVSHWGICISPSGVTRGGPPRVTPEGKKFLWLNLQRIVDKQGRTGKKRAG